MTLDLSRRETLALGLGAAALTLAPRSALAERLSYALEPRKIADGVWMIEGANESINQKNGGAIANITIFDAKEGAVIVDAGPSHLYGEALKATATRLTGKPVARVYLTHIHTDHVLGATAFDPEIVYTTPELAADLKVRGSGLTDAMYRVVGDWMRGTATPEPHKDVAGEHEDVGERRFRFLKLSGHTSSDLVLFEERSGVMVAGDVVFLDRAPTTPDARIADWRTSLATLGGVEHSVLAPGHGPAEPGKRGLGQTRDWLDMVEERIAAGFEKGLDVTELQAAPLPGWTDRIAVARYEFARSVMHLMPGLEVARLPKLEA